METAWLPWITAHHGSLKEDGQLVLPDEDKQIAAVMDGQAWTPLTDYALLQITGEDAETFLQGQFSSDVRLLQDGTQGQYSSYSTAKGRMLASFFLWRKDDSYYMLLSKDLAADTTKRLSIFVLRAKVKITDISDQIMMCAISGNAAARFTDDSLQAIGSIGYRNGLTSIRMGNGTVLITGEPDAVQTLAGGLSDVPVVGSNAWRLFDLMAGIVWVRAATKEGFVPQMANMDIIGAVSFTKGCYPGQEIVARAQYRGQIKRHLYRISSQEPLFAGDELISADTGEQSIGLLADVCQLSENHWQALAVVQDAAWETRVFVKTRPEQTVQCVCRQNALIRPYQSGDQQRVLDIWLEASRIAHPFLTESDLQRHYALVRDKYLPESQVMVAARGQEVLGFIGLLDDFIGGLFVDPTAQGTGIGSNLLAVAMIEHAQLSVDVYARNEAAVGFYLSQGFVETERRPIDDEGRQQEMIRMLKKSS